MRALANPNHHSYLQTEAILESYQKSCPNRSVHLSIGCEFGNATRSWLSSLSNGLADDILYYWVAMPPFTSLAEARKRIEGRRPVTSFDLPPDRSW